MKNIDKKIHNRCEKIYHRILDSGIYMSYVMPLELKKNIEMRQFRDILFTISKRDGFKQ